MTDTAFDVFHEIHSTDSSRALLRALLRALVRALVRQGPMRRGPRGGIPQGKARTRTRLVDGIHDQTSGEWTPDKPRHVGHRGPGNNVGGRGLAYSGWKLDGLDVRRVDRGTFWALCAVHRELSGALQLMGLAGAGVTLAFGAKVNKMFLIVPAVLTLAIGNLFVGTATNAPLFIIGFLAVSVAYFCLIPLLLALAAELDTHSGQLVVLVGAGALVAGGIAPAVGGWIAGTAEHWPRLGVTALAAVLLALPLMVAPVRVARQRMAMPGMVAPDL